MTEVPEHLLARSRARREAAGLATPGAAPVETSGGEIEPAGASSAAPATTPAPATPPAPAPAPPPPPKPDPPYVRAYKERKKIPFWALPALVALPFWAFIYANTLETPPAAATGPLAEGATIYANNCASCHGSSGEGGVGPSFQNGSVTATWPNYKDHILWVELGASGWPSPTYGAKNKPVGAGGMPSFKGTLTPAEIVMVVRYEREVLAGGAIDPDLEALSNDAA